MEDKRTTENKPGCMGMLGNLGTLLLFNLMVVAMAAGALWFGWRGYTLTTNGDTTMARVVALSESTDGDGDCCVYSPVFEYTVNGRRHSFESMNASYPPAYRVGQEVEVIYNVDNPNDAAVNSFGELWMVATILGGATVVLAVVLNGFALVRMRRGEPVFQSDD